MAARGSRAAAAMAAGSGPAGAGAGLEVPAAAGLPAAALEEGARRRSSLASNWPRLPMFPSLAEAWTPGPVNTLGRHATLITTTDTAHPVATLGHHNSRILAST